MKYPLPSICTASSLIFVMFLTSGATSASLASSSRLPTDPMISVATSQPTPARGKFEGKWSLPIETTNDCIFTQTVTLIVEKDSVSGSFEDQAGDVDFSGYIGKDGKFDLWIEYCALIDHPNCVATRTMTIQGFFGDGIGEAYVSDEEYNCDFVVPLKRH